MILFQTIPDEVKALRDQNLDSYIRLIAQDSRDGLEALYRETSTAIYAYALSVLKDPHDAEDVLHVDKESTDYHSDPPVSPGQDETPTLISKEEAKQIAPNHAGLQASAITDYECELDRDDGKIIYEISFQYGNKEYEFEINAVTGEIIHWEVEIDD